MIAIIGMRKAHGQKASVARTSAFEVHGPSCEKPQVSTMRVAFGYGSVNLMKDRRPQPWRFALRLLRLKLTHNQERAFLCRFTDVK